MTDRELQGRRVLVIGSSKGIGRAIGLMADQEGACVAFAARSKDRLDSAVDACSGSAIAVACDVRDPDSCESAVREAVAGLGGLDAIVYSTGIVLYKALSQTNADDWRNVIETNLLGAAHITRAAVPHLEATRGHAVYLSSNSASSLPPWRGIAAYTVSKVGLERMVRSWQLEHPQIAFTNYIVGPTLSEIVHADETAANQFGQEWAQRGLVNMTMLNPDIHAAAIVAILASPALYETIAVVPRYDASPDTKGHHAVPAVAERQQLRAT